jgi:hypothetical protein
VAQIVNLRRRFAISKQPLTCYWAKPDDYMHIALREIRRADILWNENEIEAYERLKQSAIPEYVKKIVNAHEDPSGFRDE